MTTEQISQALERVSPGLEKYLSIMEMLYNVDVSKNKNFQKAFNGFYRVRQRKSEFYNKYYFFMEANKHTNPSFKKTLLFLYDELGRVEASFSTKLVATINPNLPIWDSVVLGNLGLKQPSTYGKNRIKDTIDLYDKLISWYRDFVITEQGKEIIKLFNEKYPKAKITDVKKIDFVLWQIREQA